MKTFFTIFTLLLFTISSLSGQRWQQMEEPANGEGFRMATDGSTVWATMQGGLYASADQGDSWQLVNTIPYDRTVFGVDYADGELLVTAIQINYQTFEYNSFLYISKDDGVNWEIMKTPLQPSSVVVNVAKVGDFYIVFNSSQYYISKNGGQDWENMEQTNFDNIASIAWNNLSIFVIRNNSVYQTINGGVNWRTMGVNVGNQVAVVDEEVYVSGDNGVVNYTSDYGATWTNFQLSDTNARIRNIVEGAGNRRYFLTSNSKIGVSEGVNTSIDFPDFLNNDEVFHLVEQGAGNLIGIGRNGFSTTSYLTATPWTNTGLNLTGVTPFRFYQLGPDSIFSSGIGGVHFFDNNTNDWLKDTTRKAYIGISPADYQRDTLWFVENDTLFLSSDGGRSAQFVMTSFQLTNYRGSVVKRKGDKVFLLLDEDLYSYQTTNQEWDTLKQRTGPALFAPNDRLITETAFYIITSSGEVVSSVDDGVTWMEYGPINVGNIGYDFLWELNDQRVIIIGFDDWYYTDDDGQNWTAYQPQGIPISGGRNAYPEQVTSLDGDVYATFWSYGVYKSEDNGLTWSPFNEGLPTVYAQPITTHPEGFLLMGSRVGGIWKNDLMTSVKDKRLTFNDLKVFPNPGHDLFQLQIRKLSDPGFRNQQNNPGSGIVQVFDQQGQLILSQQINIHQGIII